MLLIFRCLFPGLVLVGVPQEAGLLETCPLFWLHRWYSGYSRDGVPYGDTGLEVPALSGVWLQSGEFIEMLKLLVCIIRLLPAKVVGDQGSVFMVLVVCPTS